MNRVFKIKLDIFSIKKLILVFIVMGTLWLFATAISEQNIRVAFVGLIFFILGVACLKLETGIIALLLWLPFMAFMRRFIYSFNPYVRYDPILIISPVLTLFIFSYVFVLHGEEITRLAQRNKLLSYITYFVILLILQIFNPLQGELAVGVGGAIYWVIPFLWFYFGFFVNRTRMQGIFYIIVIIGVITAIYGIYQIYHGFLPFEEYWIKYGGLVALRISRFTKAFSTFTNPQELSQYLMIGAAISFLYLFEKPRLYILWISSFLVLMYGIFMTSTRNSIFFFFVFIGIFIGLKAGNWMKALALNLLFLGVVIWGISNLPLPSSSIPIESAQKAHFSHLAKGVRHPLAKESTGRKYINWLPCVWYNLVDAPFGQGIGATTIAAAKFKGMNPGGISEIFHYAIPASLGVPGVILYILIMYWVIKISISLVKKDSKSYLIPASLAIWFTIAVEPRLYSTGPFICLLWGWIAKEGTAIMNMR